MVSQSVFSDRLWVSYPRADFFIDKGHNRVVR